MASAPKAIPFVARPQVVATPEPISQNEIALLLSLRGRLLQLEEQVESAEKSIRERLERGAVVEPGDHIARIEEHFRANIAWKEKAIDLAERLGLNGQAWAQQVLSHTTKARSASSRRKAPSSVLMATYVTFRDCSSASHLTT